MKSQYFGQIYLDESGKKKLKLLNPEQMILDIDRYDVGDKIIMKLETFYRKRSKLQNDTLHWYFQTLADETGHLPAEIKEMMKFKFLKVPMTDRNGNEVVDSETGNVEMTVRETKSLTTVECMTFVEDIREWSDRVLGVFLPEPDKNWRLNLK